MPSSLLYFGLHLVMSESADDSARGHGKFVNKSRVSRKRREIKTDTGGRALLATHSTAKCQSRKAGRLTFVFLKG
jgi:hypothetical protein